MNELRKVVAGVYNETGNKNLLTILAASDAYFDGLDLLLLQVGTRTMGHLYNVVWNYVLQTDYTDDDPCKWLRVHVLDYIEYVHDTYDRGVISFHASGRGARF